jgi:hypothetical protein
VRDRRDRDERDGELPGATLAPRQRAREPDQRDAERECEHARGLRHAGRQDAADEVRARRQLRRQCRADADEADEPRCGGENRRSGGT